MLRRINVPDNLINNIFYVFWWSLLNYIVDFYLNFVYLRHVESINNMEKDIPGKTCQSVFFASYE